MSYCRFVECDVYAYDSVEGGVQFYVSRKKTDECLDLLCKTYHEAYRYAKALRDEHGLEVPSYAIESMRVDALEELVRDMWEFYCVVPDEPHASKEELDFSVEVWKRMCELGVEVDG